MRSLHRPLTFLISSAPPLPSSPLPRTRHGSLALPFELVRERTGRSPGGVEEAGLGVEHVRTEEEELGVDRDRGGRAHTRDGGRMRAGRWLGFMRLRRVREEGGGGVWLWGLGDQWAFQDE